MALSAIPEDVKEFVVLCIPSIPFLEAALLMRTDPGQTWDENYLAQQLHIDEISACVLLGALHRAEALVACPPSPHTFRYQPLSDMFSQRVEQLAALYPARAREIGKLIRHRGRRAA